MGPALYAVIGGNRYHGQYRDHDDDDEKLNDSEANFSAPVPNLTRYYAVLLGVADFLCLVYGYVAYAFIYGVSINRQRGRLQGVRPLVVLFGFFG